MNYAPDYTIELPSGGKVPLLFGTKAFVAYSSKFGMTYEQISEEFSQLKGIKAEHLPEVLLQGAKWWAIVNKTEFAYGYDDAYMWIDLLGGVYSETVKDLAFLIVARYYNRTPDELLQLIKDATEQIKEQEEVKKKETELAGASFTGSELERA